MFLLLLLALPIAYIPNALHFPFGNFGGGINLTNVLFAMLAVVIPVLAPANAFRMPTTSRLTPPLIALGLVYIGAFLVAQLTSPQDFVDDLVILKTALMYPLFYFVYRNCRLDLKSTRLLIMLLLVVAVIAGVEAVLEGLDYGFLQGYQLSRRASGPFGFNYLTANRAGYFYGMFLPMFVAMALMLRGQVFWRLAAVGGCVILAFAIMATFSRQAYGIALLALLLVALRKSIVVACLAGVLMVGAVGMLPASVTERVEETGQTDAVGDEHLDVSAASRLDIWKGALGMLQSYPTGVGFNRFKHYIGDFSDWSGYDAHNYYLLVLAESGPVGAAALLWLLWRLWGLARASLRLAPPGDSEAQALGVGLCVAVVAVAAGNLSGSFFIEGDAMANFWILCGLVERYMVLKSAAQAVPDEFATAPAPPVTARFPLLHSAAGRNAAATLGDDR
jgi:O-antigen ligase